MTCAMTIVRHSITSLIALALFGAAVLGVASRARAQDASNGMSETIRPIGSGEYGSFELRVGTYRPQVGNDAFHEVFGAQDGPLIAFELDIQLFRLERVLTFSIGTGLGWVEYRANSFVMGSTTQRADERTSLGLFPIPLLAVIRIDALARYWSVPLTLTGKIGADFVAWTTSTGATTDAKGLSIGLRWAAQLGFELDVLEPSAARALDEDLGINHAFLFGEIYGSTASGGSLPVGNSLAWAAGLGFAF